MSVVEIAGTIKVRNPRESQAEIIQTFTHSYIIMKVQNIKDKKTILKASWEERLPGLTKEDSYTGNRLLSSNSVAQR